MIENEEMKQAEEQYSASSIQVLEGLEAVRKRPSMYIGDVGERGLHHLVYEVVDNSIDEAMAGFCNEIEVSINEDNSITVKDNGRGIPTGMHPKEHRSALEVVLTVLHAGGKFSKDSYKVSGGLHGVGVSCVNALADLLVAEVHREGQIHVQKYSKGKPLGPVEVVGTCNDTGTIITFHPDAEIFTQTIVYKYDTLAKRLRELAFLNKGIRISLTDLRETLEDGSHRSEVFYSQEGLKEFIDYLDAGATKLIPDPICVASDKVIPIDIALQYNNGYSERIFSYVNNINTIEGGTHLQGFKMGLSRSLKNYAEKNNLLAKFKGDLAPEDFREGLTAVISVKVAEPQFEGQTKTKLGNPEATSAVSQATWIPTWKKTRNSPRSSSKRSSWPRRRATPPAKPVKWSSARARWAAPACRANWPTARSATPSPASSSWWRVIPQAVRPSRAATAASRPSCRSAVRS